MFSLQYFLDTSSKHLFSVTSGIVSFIARYQVEINCKLHRRRRRRRFPENNNDTESIERYIGSQFLNHQSVDRSVSQLASRLPSGLSVGRTRGGSLG